jgi:hypothetical protein
MSKKTTLGIAWRQLHVPIGDNYISPFAEAILCTGFSGQQRPVPRLRRSRE